MSLAKRFPCWLVVFCDVIVLVLLSWSIVRFDLPDSLLLIFLIPCVLAAFFYSRRVYGTMIVALVIAAVWVTSLVSSSFSTSLITITMASLSGLAMTEGVHALVLARTRTEEALQRSEERLRALINATPDIICFKDDTGRWLEANHACLTLFELEGVEYHGKTDAELATSSPFYRDVFLVCRETDEATWRHGAISRHEVQFPPQAGASYVYDMIKVPLFQPDGQRRGLVVLGRDITERKNIEKTRQEEQERLVNILWGTGAGTWEWNIQTGETHFNARWAGIIGYSLEEISPVSIQTWERFSHPDDLSRSNAALERYFRGETDYYECDCRMRHKDGHWVWVLDRGQVVTWTADGKPLWMAGTHLDITDRKQVEAELLKTKESLEQTSRMARVGGWEDNLITGVIHWSTVTKEIHGVPMDFTPDLQNSINFCKEGESRDRITAAVRQAIDHGAPFDVELQIVTAQGNERWIRAIGYPEFQEGRCVRLYGTLQDIDERVRAEKALRESEANFHAFFETITDLIVVGAPDGHILFTNSAVSRVLGYSAAELVGMHILDLHPVDKRAEATEILTAMFRGERESCPLPLARRDGTLVPVETRIWMGRWDGQDCIFGLSKNLTAEQEAQQRFERLFRNNPASMALSRLPDRQFVDVNNAFLTATGYTREEVIGKTAAELNLFARPEEQQQVAEQLQAQKHIANIEAQTRCKDGAIHDGLFWGEVISSQGREYFLTVMIDVTERKQTEMALRESEQRYRELYGITQRQAHELSLLNQVRTILARKLELPAIFRAVVEATAEAFGYTLVSLYLRQEDTLVLQHQVGYDQVFERIPLTTGVSGRVASTGEPILLQDVHTDPTFLEAVPNIVSEMCVPLVDQGQVVGIMNVESEAPKILTAADLDLLVALGEHINIAIERARLYAEVREREHHLEELVQIRTADLRHEMDAREQAQIALRESEARFRAIYDTANALIIAHDIQGLVIHINPYACQTLGYQAEELLGRRIRSLFEESEMQRAKPLVARLMADPDFHVEGFEQYLLKKDGQRVLINWSVTALRDAAGNATAILGIGQDITARKQMEVELEHHREHLEELVAARTAELRASQALLEQTVQTLQDRERFLEKLNDITQAALETSDLTAMLQTLADRMGELFHADGCYLTLWDEERQKTIAGAAYGAWRGRYRAIEIAPDETTVTATVLRTGHPVAVEDVYNTPYLSPRIAGMFPDRSLLGLPLIAADRKLGAALIAYNETHAFTPLEIARGEQTARQIALAVAKARLYQELQAYAGQLEERVRARTAELQAQYAQLDAILRSVDDAICMTDPAGRAQYINPAFTRLTGYASAEVLQQDIRQLSALAEFASRLPAILPTLLQGKLWQGEGQMRRKYGRSYDAALTIAPVHDEAGQPGGYVLTHRDVSQAKALELARNQFIANISHQLRTPLTSLKANLYLLLRADLAEKQRQRLQTMEDAVRWLTQLIQDIEELLILDSGKGIGTWVPISLPDIVEEVVRDCQEQARAGGVILKAAPIPPELPTVKGDIQRLTQALNELVENAVAFTPAGGQVAVAVQMGILDGEPWVTLVVQDTGPGITANELPRLFERFFRGRLAESGHTAGTGLGLSIAQQIAHAHGGRITVESVVGRGSTFMVWLRPEG